MNERPSSNPWLAAVLNTSRRWLMSEMQGPMESPRPDPMSARLHAHRTQLRAMWLAHGGGNPSVARTQGRVSSHSAAK